MLNFLKKMRSELKCEKTKLESEMNQIQNDLNKNHKFLQSLKEEEEQNFEIFSPRRKNAKMRDNIEMIEQEQSDLTDRLNELQKRSFQINIRLEELDHLIRNIRKKKIEESETDPISLNANMKSLIQKIELSIQLIRIDPNRCKMELSSAKKILQEMQKKITSDSSSFHRGGNDDGN